MASSIFLIINSLALILHIIMEEIYKKRAAVREQLLLGILQQLVDINNAYLPWMYEKFSEQEKKEVGLLINGYKG